MERYNGRHCISSGLARKACFTAVTAGVGARHRMANDIIRGPARPRRTRCGRGDRGFVSKRVLSAEVGVTGLGTALNMGAVIAGTVVGVGLGQRLPVRVRETVTDGLGLLTIITVSYTHLRAHETD